MEKPYKGRATIQDNITDVQIIIPAKRNWFIILFVGGWLGGWLVGEIFALGTVTGLSGEGGPGRLFVLFWLILWTGGGFFAFKIFLWNLIGSEMITVGQGGLKIDKKGALLFKAKTYDLNEVKNIRTQDDSFGDVGLFGIRPSAVGAFRAAGTIRFDYGLQTVRFAQGIDEAEAKFVLEKLKERHLLTEKNYH
jgi:hypothetical protein